MSGRDAGINCPSCGSSSVRRSRRANSTEITRMMLGIYPFRCNNCNDRFWANVWLFNSLRWAKCPLCLNRNLTDWPKRHYHVTTWAQLLSMLGAKKHRCSRCRNNFMSFKSRLPQYEGTQADADDLDFDAERQVESSSPEPEKTPAAPSKSDQSSSTPD